MSNSNLMIGAAVVALILVSFKPKRKEDEEAPSAPSSGSQVVQPTEVDIRNALRSVLAKHGRAIAENVERIYRLETAHFTSGQFRRTNTAGMRAQGASYPWGWARRGTSPDMFAPLVNMAENAGGPVVPWVAFILFRDAAVYLGDFLADYNNNPGRWNSTDPARQVAYNAAIQAVTPRIVNSL